MIGEAPNSENMPVKVQRAAPTPVRNKGKGGANLSGANLAAGDENRRLTRTEQKVLEVLLSPETRHATSVEKIKAAGVSKARYYEILADPWFDEQRRKGIQALVREQAAAFVEAAAKTAMTPGRDGFQDRRLLLTLSGDHVERRQHDVEVAGRVVVGVIGVSMDELG